MFQLRLFHDDYAPGAAVKSPPLVPHTMFYVFRGAAAVAGTVLNETDARYVSDYAPVEAGGGGAVIWRWELVDRTTAPGVVEAGGVQSVLRMARDVKMFELAPTTKWLFRLDSIIGFEGTTGMHSHPGSGIRCLLSGHLRAESEKGENSDNRNPGDVWYEEGAYPLVSTVDPGIKTTFLRGMVLPPDYLGYPETANWISGQPEGGAKFEGWKPLAQQVVTLR